MLREPIAAIVIASARLVAGINSMASTSAAADLFCALYSPVMHSPVPIETIASRTIITEITKKPGPLRLCVLCASVFMFPAKLQ